MTATAAQVWVGQDWERKQPQRGGGRPDTVHINHFSDRPGGRIAHCTLVAGRGSRRRPGLTVPVDHLVRDWRRV